MSPEPHPTDRAWLASEDPVEGGPAASSRGDTSGETVPSVPPAESFPRSLRKDAIDRIIIRAKLRILVDGIIARVDSFHKDLILVTGIPGRGQRLSQDA
jgi:hypothetical protein